MAQPPGGAHQITRALRETDLGLDSRALRELSGTFSVAEGAATVRIDMMRGNIASPFAVLNSLMETAQAYGARSLRIEGSLANERLYNVLTERYGMKTEAGVDFIEILFE